MSVVERHNLSDREALGVADDLAQYRDIKAVCIAGSSARGDSSRGSDIDLLGLVDDRDAAFRVRTSFTLRRKPGERRVQLRLLSEEKLRRLFERRSSFAIHVLREGLVLYDPAGRFAEVVAPHSRDAPVRDNREDLLTRLEPYGDLAWCQGLYLHCLSDLYSIGRAAAITILGRESRFEFAGTRALRTVARTHPELATAARRVEALRPFFLLATRDEAGALPFPYRDSHERTSEARQASVALVEAIR